MKTSTFHPQVRTTGETAQARPSQSAQTIVSNIVELARGLDAEVHSGSIDKTQQIREAVFAARDVFGRFPVDKNPSTLEQLFRQELSTAYTVFENADRRKSNEGVDPHAASTAVLGLLRAVEVSKLSEGNRAMYLNRSGNDGFVVRQEVAQRATRELMQLKLATPVQHAASESTFRTPPAIEQRPAVTGQALQATIVNTHIVQNNIYSIDDHSVSLTDNSLHVDNSRHVNASGAQIGVVNTGDSVNIEDATGNSTKSAPAKETVDEWTIVAKKVIS